jgi:hypothetical protein
MSEAPEFDQGVQALSDDVLVSLELDAMANRSERAKRGISNVVASSMIEIASLLSVPLPEAVPYFDWYGSKHLEIILGRKRDEYNGVFFTPREDFDEKTDKYRIGISPILLEAVAKSIDQGFGEKGINCLRSLVAHEMYHEFQCIHFPNTYQTSVSSRWEETHDDWLKSRLEKGATIFSRQYLKGRTVGGLRDWYTRGEEVRRLGRLVREMEKIHKK